MIHLDRNIHPQQVPNVINLVTPKNTTNKSITENDPAISVMTDLKKVTPFTIESSAPIEAINNKMIACGVRLLFVNDPQGNLAGLITTTDIQGEKPLLYVTNNGGSRDDISANDLMTPLGKLEGIPLEEVKKAHVSDICKALKECRRKHMLVIESRAEGKFIRGIFSATQLSRQLGTNISPSYRAESFAQLNRALA